MYRECFKSHKYKVLLLVMGFVIIGLGSFATGLKVGLDKARFSYNWGENYERNFIGPKQGGFPGGFEGPGRMMGGAGRGGFGMMGQAFRNGHGIGGDIISISENSLVVKDDSNNENKVNVTDKTIIKMYGEDLKFSDLKQDQRVVVMGKPNESGSIDAVLIRVFQK
jgi:hypothetical protein